MTSRASAPTTSPPVASSPSWDSMPTSRKLQQGYFYPPNFPSLTLRIRPLAMLAILDGAQRKPYTSSRTIGVLLGALVEGRIVDVVDAFTLPLMDNENKGQQQQQDKQHDTSSTTTQEKTDPSSPLKEVTFNKDYCTQMFALKKRGAPRGGEAVVGWWATGNHPGRDVNTAHTFFGTKTSGFVMHHPLTSPILLMVDTNATEGYLAVKAFFGNHEPLRGARGLTAPPQKQSLASSLAEGGIGGGGSRGAFQNGVVWHEIPATIETQGCEAQSLEVLGHCEGIRKTTSHGGSAPIKGEHLGYETALKRLQQLIDIATTYSQEVIDGKREGDAEVGRGLWSIISAPPLVPGEQLPQLCHDAVQDTLMTVYLANLTRMQTAMALRIASQQQTQQQQQQQQDR